MPHDINRLKEKTDRLDRSVSSLGGFAGALSGIIHKPGWTSVAEFALVEASLDALYRHVETAADHYRQLIAAADKVGNS
jgi:hypothetical protein